jgi:hypothetical protein
LIVVAFASEIVDVVMAFGSERPQPIAALLKFWNEITGRAASCKRQYLVPPASTLRFLQRYA